MSAEKKVMSNISIEGAKLIFRNFQGKKTQYNEEGRRTFGVFLDDDLAEALIEDGWKVRYLRPKEDDPEQHRQAWLSVRVKFSPYPPIVTLITSKGKKKLTEETIDQLDWSIITNCDLIIRPYNYPETPTRPAGVAAYLKAMYITLAEDEFAQKYADLEDLDAVEEDEEE